MEHLAGQDQSSRNWRWFASFRSEGKGKKFLTKGTRNGMLQGIEYSRSFGISRLIENVSQRRSPGKSSWAFCSRDELIGVATDRIPKYSWDWRFPWKKTCCRSILLSPTFWQKEKNEREILGFFLMLRIFPVGHAPFPILNASRLTRNTLVSDNLWLMHCSNVSLVELSWLDLLCLIDYVNDARTSKFDKLTSVLTCSVSKTHWYVCHWLSNCFEFDLLINCPT